MSGSYTPMMEQYLEIKRQHRDEVLFFRLGDFYEMFFDDAEKISKELEITLTSREAGSEKRVPMCGIPYHAADNYIARLIQKGYKVAICEQVEDPKLVKGLVRREVVRIITPGTVLDEILVPEKSNQYLTLLVEDDSTYALATTDITTGECTWAIFSGQQRTLALLDYLFRIWPAELVISGKISTIAEIEAFLEVRLSSCSITTQIIDDLSATQKLLSQHFPHEEWPDSAVAQMAVNHLLYYLHHTLKSSVSHINRLTRYNAQDFLLMDYATLRNLEISRNMREGSKKDSLFSVLDFTHTAMGGRMLKKWLENPLLHPPAILERQNGIAEFLEKTTLHKQLEDQLTSVYDLERIITRIELGTANARDLVALKLSLAQLPTIKSILTVDSKILSQAASSLHTHPDITTLLEDAIMESPPASVREGGIIKPGYDLELDELRAISRDSKQWIQEMEIRERETTGIKSLKIGYNRVFGYYLEVTHSNASSVPANYVRKQTLTNAERYITPELKEFETKILGAQEKIVQIEYYLFSQIAIYIKERIHELQNTAYQLSILDALSSLATAASRNNYVRPTISLQRDIMIRDGRHPVVEKLLTKELFVPNDTTLNHYENEILIITGPNMAGKSTYMRQVALITLMAQVGSYVPAAEATISPVDRIFTRIGASDDLATGQSTFMVEMNEVSHILRNATSNSLLILDEVGRGTSTFDGISIARSVVEYIRERIKAKTLFATHYHELTELAELHTRVQNYSVAVKEKGNDILFLRRIIPGSADKSYGIHVAQLAGLPKKVIEKAQEYLTEFETHQFHERVLTCTPSPNELSKLQTISLFQSTILERLLGIDPLTLTPLEALNLLYQLQQQAKEEAGHR